jgi:hypothetical protein
MGATASMDTLHLEIQLLTSSYERRFAGFRSNLILARELEGFFPFGGKRSTKY